MIFDVLKFILICIEVVLIFNLMIVVHELGHFLAAKWRGLVVEKFAIWFGKPIWSKTINGVEYRLGSIPAGGFVAIPQLAPMEMMEGEVDKDRSAYPPIKPIDKIIVAFAGPAFSFGLAILFAIVVWIVGRPVSQADLTTTVGFVLPDSPAQAAGILPGDKILKINNVPVTQFGPAGDARASIVWNIARSVEPTIPIEIERGNAIKTVEVSPIIAKREGWGRKNLRSIGVAPAMTPKIAKVTPDSPAAAAGLQPGDVVVSANGAKLLSMAQVSDILKSNGAAPVDLGIQRGNQSLEVQVLPRKPENEDLYRIGVQWDFEGVLTRAHPTPVQQISASVTTMWDTLSALFTPKSEIGLQHLSGPVGIMHAYYILFEREDGWLLALWFSVVLNVNLALLNLLPIPVLDGGHITLAIIEKIIRRPVNVRILEFVQSGFAMLLIGFMLYVTFFDVLDLGRSGGGKEPAVEEMKFSPEPSASPAAAQ